MIEKAHLAHLIQLRRYRDAEDYAKKCLNLYPEWSEGYSRLSMILSAKDEKWEAFQQALEGVVKDPQSPFAHYVLAYSLARRREFNQARHSVRQTLRLQPDFVRAYWLASEIERCDGSLIDALRWCDDGLSHEPADESLRIQRATLLLLQDQNAEAIKWIKESLRLFPESADHWQLKARTLHEFADRKLIPDTRLRARIDAAYREALRLDASQVLLQEYFRINQMSQRIIVIFPFLFATMFIWLAFICYSEPLIDSKYTNPTLVNISNVVVIAMIVWFTLMIATSVRQNAFLAAPLKWAGIEPFPLTIKQHQNGVIMWRIGLALYATTFLCIFCRWIAR